MVQERLSHTALNDEDIAAKAAILKIIGHPLRLRIVAGLSQKRCCVREIWECLQLPQAIVSQHLKVLKDHGILESRREGARVCYSLKNAAIRDVVRALDL